MLIAAFITSLLVNGLMWFVIGLLKDENKRLREEIGGSDYEQKEP